MAKIYLIFVEKLANSWLLATFAGAISQILYPQGVLTSIFSSHLTHAKVSQSKH